MQSFFTLEHRGSCPLLGPVFTSDKQADVFKLREWIFAETSHWDFGAMQQRVLKSGTKLNELVAVTALLRTSGLPCFCQPSSHGRRDISGSSHLACRFLYCISRHRCTQHRCIP